MSSFAPGVPRRRRALVNDMNDKNKTKSQLISELQQLRRHVNELETAAAGQTGNASFLTMAEAAASAIFVFRDSVFLYANPATAKLTGYTVEELIGRNIWTLVHPEFLDRNERVLAFQRGEAVSPKSEFKIVTRGGATRWLNADATITEFGGSPAVLTIAYDSTAHKLAQEALQISEQRYRNILETAQEAIWVVDPNAITTYVNDRLAQMLGYEPDEILGHSVFDFVDPADHQETRQYLERGRQGFKERLDYRFRCKDGSHIWTMLSTTPLFDVAGEFIGGLAMLIDITERKKTERALKQSEALLHAAIDNLPFELSVRDRNRRCVIQNPYSVLQWGDQIGNRLEHMATDAAAIDQLLGYHQRALAGEVVKDEFKIESGDQAGDYYGIVAPVRVDGEVTGVLEVNIDITDRKRGEEALRESEGKFRALAESTAAAIFIYRGDKLLYVNPATKVHTGYDAGELLSTSFMDVIHPDCRDIVRRRALARQRGEAVPDRYEFKIITKSGEGRWIDATASLLEYEGQMAAIGTAFDITAQKQAADELRDAQDKLHHVLLYSPAIIYSLKVEESSLITQWISESLTRLTGYEVEEAFSGTWWRDHIHPDDRTRVLETMNLLSVADRLVLEYRFQHKQKGYVWLHDEIRLLRDESGNPVEAIGSWVDVTERREAEEALGESEQRFSTLVTSMTDTVFTLDREHRITALFGRLAEGSGLEPDYYLGKTARELFGPDAALVHEDAVARALAGEQIVYEWSGVYEQKTLYFQTSLAPLRNQSGEVAGLVGVGRDITERKRLDRALWESEDRFRSFMGHMPGYAWIKNVDGSYVYLNERLRETLSYHQDDWRGRTDTELFPSEIAPQFQRNDQIVLESREESQAVEAWTWKGQQRYALVTKFPINDGQGDIVLVAGTSVDITDLRRAEDELRTQKELLQKIIDHVPVIIRFLGEDGRIKLVNKEFERRLGWALDEIQGRNLDILAEAYPDPLYRTTVMDFVTKADGEWADFKTTTRDGRVIDTTWANVRLADGAILGIGQDITERKRAEHALHQARARTESVLESVADVHILLDYDWHCLYANDAAVRAIGRPREELLEYSLWEVYPDIIGTELDRQYHRAMDERVQVSFDFYYPTLDTWWKNRFYPVPEGVAVFATDVTESKRAEEALRQRTGQLAALHEIDLEISAESDLSRVLDIVTQRASELLRASHCSTYIRDNHAAELTVVASLDRDLIGTRLKRGEGLAGLVGVTACAQIIDDYDAWDGRAAIYEGRSFGPALGAPLKWQQTVIGVISLSRASGEARFTDKDLLLLEQLAAEAAIAIHQATLIDELQESRARLQVLSHRLIDSQEAERKRIARELHDQIGQALTAIQISLQAAKSTPDGGTASIVEDCLAIIDESLELVHDLSFDLRPSLLDDLGLGAALRWYVERATARADLLACLNVDVLGGRFSSEVETACFRIAQESLTNVVRHASARTVFVTLAHEEACLKLTVKDDGVGFDVHEALDRKGRNTSLGLQGMRERASALGGTVEIKSHPGNGTAIEASFPI